MGRIEDAIRSYLREDDWPLEESELDGVLVTRIGGTSGDWILVTVVREDEEQLLLYSVYPDLVPEQHLDEAMTYVTRANWDLSIGAFELDLDTGEARFRTSIDLEGVDPSEPLLRSLVQSNVVVMDRYLPGLEAICRGEPADDTIAEIEAHRA